MKHKTKQISQLIRKAVNTVDREAEVILYGSRARGDEHPGSDWDILILTDYPADIHIERQFRARLYDLELETGEPFSVFVYSKEDWRTRQHPSPFYENVMEEGIQV